MDKTEILQNCNFVKPKGVYFWRQNHMTQFNKNVNWKVALDGARFLADIQSAVKREHHGVKFVPNMDTMVKGGAVLDKFASYFTEMAFPIIIDKMYNLNDVQSAFNYAFNNDDSVLGENIGILIEKENDQSIVFEENCRPKTVKLPSIDTLYDKNNNKRKSKQYDVEEAYNSIDDIVEHETNLNDHGFVQDKTQIFE